MPYSIRILSAGLSEFDVSLEEAAWSLGCGRVKAFYYVLLPHLKSSILGALLMSFITSFNNLPVSMFLKGPGVNTLPCCLNESSRISFRSQCQCFECFVNGDNVCINASF